MTDKVQLIKQELERIEQILDDFNKTHNNTIDNGIVSAKKNICKHIKSFIDSLPEEPVSEDLEKEVDEEIDNLCELGCYMEDLAKGNSEGVYPLPNNVVKELRKFARHFAEWQKQQMKEALQTEYEKGRFDMREEMMKALIGGEIVKDIHNQLSVKPEPLNNAFGDIKFGDKVKIIILKTE